MSLEPEDETPVEIARWAADFRAFAPEPAVAKTLDPTPILERATSDARKTRHEWVAQIGGTTFAIANFLGLVAWRRTAMVAAIAAFVLPVLVALFGYFVYTQASQRRVAGEAIADHVAAAVRRNRARYQVARASLLTLAILTVGFWIWLPFFLLGSADKLAAQPWRIAIAVVAALTIFGLGFWRATRVVRSARQELESWRAVAASLAG